MRFSEKLRTAQQSRRSLLCVGLDPVPERFPSSLSSSSSAIRDFNRAIIEATSDLACCYKPNLGFYLAHDHNGLDALLSLGEDVPDNIPLLLDAKMGDLNVTSEGYARAYFDVWDFDAVTAHPYMGRDGLEPLFEREGRAIFILARTSNPGSAFLQSREIDAQGERQTVADYVAAQAEAWSRDSVAELGLVAGATYPEELASIRRSAPSLPILIPGVGAQGGNLQDAVSAGLDEHGAGILVNSSRAISYASSGSDFQDAARAVASRMRDEINAARESVAARP